MSELLFGVAVLAVIVIFILTLVQVVKDDFEFWPPPNATSWQHTTFRMLFRVYFVCLVVLSFLEFDSSSPWATALGGTLLVIGFGLALWWTGFLGWKNAFGEATGLKTHGPFAFSRNPIYMVSILGMFGWAVLIGSTLVAVLLLVWACWYIMAPFVEEPWMAKNYGDEFGKYSASVPRYGSLSAVGDSLLTWLELKVPPLAIILIAGAMMYWAAEFVPHGALVSTSLRIGLMVSAEILAIAILIAALLSFRKHQTTMNPLDPDQTNRVVTSGVYDYSRNPMYLSMLFALLDWAFYLGQLSATVGLLFYFLAITRLQIVPEEKILKRKFEETYENYCKATHRWYSFELCRLQ
jgi:protein-S-isoprenylcysteine O-methyltransferase Ste14